MRVIRVLNGCSNEARLSIHHGNGVHRPHVHEDFDLAQQGAGIHLLESPAQESSRFVVEAAFTRLSSTSITSFLSDHPIFSTRGSRALIIRNQKAVRSSTLMTLLTSDVRCLDGDPVVYHSGGRKRRRKKMSSGTCSKDACDHALPDLRCSAAVCRDGIQPRRAGAFGRVHHAHEKILASRQQKHPTATTIVP